eukprot:COSAG05_NODE_1866_length_3934_cov_1.989048_6_plen_88_part_00
MPFFMPLFMPFFMQHASKHLASNWSLPIRSNITDGAVSWAVPYSVVNRRSLRGKQVVIELWFNDATIYAYGFADRHQSSAGGEKKTD